MYAKHIRTCEGGEIGESDADGRKEDEGWREGEKRNDEWICGLYPREYYGFKVSRGLTK